MFRRISCLLGSVAASISPASFASDFDKFRSLVQTFHANDADAAQLVDQTHVSDLMLEILWKTSQSELTALIDGITVMRGPDGLIMTPEVGQRLRAVVSFIKEKLSCRLIHCPWLGEVVEAARRENHDPTPRIWCRVAQERSERLEAERIEAREAQRLRSEAFGQSWASALAELLHTRPDEVAECCAFVVDAENLPPTVYATPADANVVSAANADASAEDDDDLYN